MSIAGNHASHGSVALATHIELLRAREVHRRLEILKAYLQRISDITPEHRLSDFHTSDGKDLERSLRAHSRTISDLPTTISKDLRRKTEALEAAVLRSHQRLQEEKQRFDEVQLRTASGTERRANEVSVSARLRAFDATRTVLGRWIEESLDHCNHSANLGREDNSEDQDSKHTNDHRPEISELQEITDKQIQEQYAKYIVAKRAAVQAVKSLASPLPPFPASQQELEESDMQSEDTQHVTSTLPQIETQLLPLLSVSAAQTRLLHYSDAQLADERRSTTEMLDRLRDESHLLEAYPILARSERWRKTAASLGSHVEDTQYDRVTQQVEGWVFAAHAAEETLIGAIGKQSESGKSSVEGMLATLKRVEDMRKVLAEHSER